MLIFIKIIWEIKWDNKRFVIGRYNKKNYKSLNFSKSIKKQIILQFRFNLCNKQCLFLVAFFFSSTFKANKQNSISSFLNCLVFQFYPQTDASVFCTYSRLVWCLSNFQDHACLIIPNKEKTRLYLNCTTNYFKRIHAYKWDRSYGHWTSHLRIVNTTDASHSN